MLARSKSLAWVQENPRLRTKCLSGPYCLFQQFSLLFSLSPQDKLFLECPPEHFMSASIFTAEMSNTTFSKAIGKSTWQKVHHLLL